MTFKEYNELCEDLEKEISEIKGKKESKGFYSYSDICLAKELLESVKSIKEIIQFKEDSYYEKGGY